jgi:hypothetical protein
VKILSGLYRAGSASDRRTNARSPMLTRAKSTLRVERQDVPQDETNRAIDLITDANDFRRGRSGHRRVSSCAMVLWIPLGVPRSGLLGFGEGGWQ